MSLESAVVEHLRQNVDQEQLWLSRKSFYESGFALVSYLLPDEIKQQIAAEVRDLLDERSIRRDLHLAETSNSPRYMRNVTAADIRAHGGVTVGLYESEAFRGALGSVAGEAVLECPYEPEHYVITHLERSGDTHGWHWDDYSFGVILVVDCPEVAGGGFVQTVPNTSWDKSNPQVFKQLVNNPINSYELRPGDIYLLRTDTTLHRVHPLEPGAKRTIINMAYAAERDFQKEISHETMEDLFAV
ncbi:hypothetical protein ACTOB_003502 [Actinoplanes oblitus]|uniref:ArpA protein n=1 Tax=Actinoplanes oblitus TaxID=3040509 RepID=A0ABY8WSR8_9ACTN|nr:hypothetical protein [Actinoplanes oblitus]WIM99837.1 hypothetical protein ACTOB_003502 [Actinoplanes oblitus]